ncbi:DNA alkylation repair protein [Gottfriedia luciferensis]|uniref:DNA alkylation repair protein n=1 Tax=Gottfriedia luciferensis TaxID=178774 RepID=UPI000B44C25F|nr:DNA alkylation repair protein [Gottfriedia luciferensis]
MAEALKNIYNHDLILKIANEISKVYSDFNRDTFIEKIFDEKWEEKTLKERMRHITISLGETLPNHFEEAIEILTKIKGQFPENSLSSIFFPDFVEVYGLESWERSMEALELFTQHSTSEFAVRPFIVLDQERMMAQMLKWSTSSNEHVRRLASEGCRPKLPWGMVLKNLKIDPTPILPILENLKEDESLYVRKSVANNLNDISKDHPNLVLELAKEWYGKNPHTNWIIKHACRTLLKKGNKEALTIFGFQSTEAITIANFQLYTDQIKIGEDLNFSFEILSSAPSPTKIRIEFVIDYVKSKGNRSKKIFKISENTIEKNKTLTYNKVHSFKDLSTRKHYPGQHSISLFINGLESGTKDFFLE